MNAFSKLFVATAILFSANFASATVPSFPTQPGDLTAEQCTKLRSDLDKYIAYVNAWLLAQPKRLQKLLKPYVNYSIAKAEKYVDKVCPESSGNGYSPNSPYNCIVEDSSFQPIALGLDSNGTFVLTQAREKTVCMSANACNSIVAQKILTFGPQISSACQDPADQTVQHLTDAEVQTKINAIP